MAYCPSCGAAHTTGQRFCAGCGTRLSATPASSNSSNPTETSAPTGPSTPTTPRSDPGLEARFAPGTMLDERYRIVGLIGRGGMGEVYRADDLKLNQAVALKFLPERFEQDPNRLARFLNEVRVALRVSHVSVCRVYDVGEVEGRHFISMEYVDGEDLASLLRRIGRFPRERGTQIARQMCAGLAAAHEQGILHRDLKPSNVMVDGQGRVKITDFGLAGLADEIHGKEIRAGTPAYMAPEQLAGREVTLRSDIYSLGLVLYEIFVGRPVFDGTAPTDRERHAAATSTDPPSVDDLAPNVDPTILRCLEPDPARRPASANAVGEALAASDSPAVVSSVDPNRLLIFPFEARGPSETTDFIGQSLAEALAINLAMVPKFSVLPVPRGESAGPGAPTDLARVGRRQGAGHVIHGSLRREGRNVDLTVFLIDTTDGRIIGGTQKSLEEVDLTTIAASTAREVAAKLGGSVARQHEHIKSIKLPAEMATIPEVLALLAAFRCGDTGAAVKNAKQVLRLCPESAEAHALHVNAMYEAWRPEPSSKNREALDQALLRLRAVDPHSPYLDMFYGQLAYEGDGRPRAAIAAFTRLLERDDLSPTCRAWVLRNRAQPLQKIGRTGEATEDLKQAVTFAPVEPWNFYALSNILCWSRRFDEALIEAQRAVAFEPWDFRHHLVVAQALAGLSRWDEGLVHANRAYDGSRSQDAGGLRAICLQGAGRADDARIAAAEATSLAESADGMVHLARYKEMAGEPEQALEHLERAGEIGLANLDFVDDFPSLTDDKRFRHVVDSVRERLESV